MRWIIADGDPASGEEGEGEEEEEEEEEETASGLTKRTHAINL